MCFKYKNKISSYPKSKDGATTRSSRPRKRSFQGNQYSKNESSDKDKESVSTKKLSSATSENVIMNLLHCYRIIEFFTVFTALSDILICKNCKQDV